MALALANKLRKLSRYDFVRHNAVFFIGTLLISIFNYLYYPVIGRLTSVSDFGEIQAIISIFMQLGIVLTAFGYVVTNITSNTSHSDERERLIVRLEQITLLLCVFIFLALCASSFFLKSTLQFTSIIPLILVGVLVVLNVPSTSRMYFLQGVRQLKEVSLAGIIFAAGKLILSVIFILLIQDVIGVMVAYILALLATLSYVAIKTRRNFPSILTTFRIERGHTAHSKKAIRDELVYGVAILTLLSGVTLLYSSDTIVVRLFFSPEDAGYYSGISAIARIVFFITASVAGVLIAMVKMGEEYSKNLTILYRSFGIITAVGGVVALFFAVFPSFSVRLLLGGSYSGASYLLPLVSLVMLFCAYNNLLICYEIALRRFKAIYTVTFSIIVGVVLVGLFHDSLMHVVWAYLTANILVFMLLSIQIVKRKRYA